MREEVLVCGAGHQGLAMSAHLALNNVDVCIWNRTSQHIQDIIHTRKIKCTGIVSGDAIVSKASSEMSEVISDCIMVVTPSTAHKDIARQLAPYVKKDTVIILNPGRTFGAIEFIEELKRCGVNEYPHIAETQTIVYTCRKETSNSVAVLALKNGVKIASLKESDTEYIISRIPKCIRHHFTPVSSIAETSLSNIGMILHCAPMLMNIGWIESEKVDFKYYYDGISKTIAGFLEKMDGERRQVAMEYGIKVESLKEWLEHSYNVQGDNLLACIQNIEVYRKIDAPTSLNTRYLLEDVPNGLVPIEQLGIELGVETPNISTIINLACSVLNIDFRKNGRQYGLKKLREYI